MYNGLNPADLNSSAGYDIPTIKNFTTKTNGGKLVIYINLQINSLNLLINHAK